MPKFPSDVIKGQCDAQWAVIPRPEVKFSTTKRAKSYIPNGFKLYNNALSYIVAMGLPTELRIDEDTKKLYTKQFWEPLGVDCKVNDIVVKLSVLDQNGSVPLYLEKLRKNKTYKSECNRRRTIRRQDLKVLSEKYCEEAQKLFGMAGVLSFHPPQIKFIDFGNRPVKAWYNGQNLSERFQVSCADTIEDNQTFDCDVDATPYVRQPSWI
jgi:hypothetical protein